MYVNGSQTIKGLGSDEDKGSKIPTHNSQAGNRAVRMGRII